MAVEILWGGRAKDCNVQPDPPLGGERTNNKKRKFYQSKFWKTNSCKLWFIRKLKVVLDSMSWFM